MHIQTLQYGMVKPHPHVTYSSLCSTECLEDQEISNKRLAETKYVLTFSNFGA